MVRGVGIAAGVTDHAELMDDQYLSEVLQAMSQRCAAIEARLEVLENRVLDIMSALIDDGLIVRPADPRG